jgi:hypothetical protein
VETRVVITNEVVALDLLLLLLLGVAPRVGDRKKARQQRRPGLQLQ